MSSADLRYPRQTLLADYGRASAGVLLCGAPLLLLDVNRWLALILLLGFLLFVATLTVIGMLISDLALAALDPRIRFGASSEK